MNLKTLYELFRAALDEGLEDKVPRLGAALAYYSAFSLAPLVIIAIGIAGLVFEEQAARGGIVREIEGTIGHTAAVAVEDMVKHTSQSGQSGWAALTGLAVLLFGASGVFIQLQDALNTIWKVAVKPGRGLWNLIKDRFLSFAVVLGTGFLLLISLVVSAALSGLGQWLMQLGLPGGPGAWNAVNMLVSFGFITLLFAIIFKLLPDATVAWHDVWIGAVVTALLFTAGKYLLGLYLGQGSTTSAFGAAGSLVLILIWVYYSSQIMLFGAEFTQVYANRFGSHVVPTENAILLTDEARARQGMPRSEDLARRVEETKAHS